MTPSYPETHDGPATPTPARAESVIRRATTADAAVIAALGRSTFTETFGHLYPPADLQGFLAEAHSESAAHALLTEPAHALWLAEVGGRPAGYALAGPCALPHPDVTSACGELKRLYVAKPFQSAQLGGRLFEAALAWLGHAGPRTIWIGVWSQNHGAQRFYERAGFRKVGEYDFPVGASRDREFILAQVVDSFSTGRLEQCSQTGRSIHVIVDN